MIIILKYTQNLAHLNLNMLLKKLKHFLIEKIIYSKEKNPNYKI